MGTPNKRPQSRTQALASFVPPERSGRKAVLISCGVLIIIVAVMSVLCALLNVTVGFASKPDIALVGAINAVALGIPYLLVILWLDRNEKEPLHLIVTAFLWGAVISTMLSCCVNTGFGGIATGIFGGAGQQLTASFSAPFIEELTKGAAVFAIFLFFKRDFDNVLDGIVYGAVAGLGFAVFENWLYYVQVCNSIEQVFYLTFIRGVVAGVGSHAVYTAITGAGFGLFRVMRRGVIRWFMPVLAVGLAMFIHFSWNTFAGLFLDEPLASVTPQLLEERVEQAGWTVTKAPKKKTEKTYVRYRMEVKNKDPKSEAKIRLYKTKSNKAKADRIAYFEKKGYVYYARDLAVVGVKVEDAPLNAGPVIAQQLLAAVASPSLKEIASGPIFLPAIVIHIPFVLLVLIVTLITLWHESKLIKKYLEGEGPPILHDGEMKKLLPASRRSLHRWSLLWTFKFGAWSVRRKRNARLVRLAFEKWHMDQEAQGEAHAEGHLHAVRVLSLREELTKLKPLD